MAFCALIAIIRLPAWQKGVIFLVPLVCLSMYEQHYSKSYKQIAMKFYGGVWNSLNCGGDLGPLRLVKRAKKYPQY